MTARKVSSMYNAISRSQLFVLDQDVALDFYTNTLGFELADDVDFGFMRWLTVRIPGDPDREVLLELVGPPAIDPDTAEVARELLTKGAMGGWLSVSTDDVWRAHEILTERGVDIIDEPTERPYGIDFAIRDPFGNAIRIGQLNDHEEV